MLHAINYSTPTTLAARAITRMSVAGFEAQDPAVTVTDLLAYDEGQLVHYLKRHEVYGGFDISTLVGVETLSGSQREELAQRLW